MGLFSWLRHRPGLLLLTVVTAITLQLPPLLMAPGLIGQAPAQATRPSAIATAADHGRVIAQLPNFPAVLTDFNLTANGFEFTNSDLVAAVQRISADDWEYLLTEPLMELFGSQICVGEDSTRCLLTAPAQNWLRTQLRLMRQGLCEGMAAGSLFLWESQNQAPSGGFWRSVVNSLTSLVASQIPGGNLVLRTLLTNLFLLQGVDQVAQPTQAIRLNTPVQILWQLVRAIANRPEDPYTMGIYRQQDGQLVEGHSLVPYRVEEMVPDQEYRVYVYDSNYPADQPPPAPYVTFDVASDRWRYQPEPGVDAFAGDSQSHNLDLTQLSWRLPPLSSDAIAAEGPLTCPFCDVPRTQPASIALIGQGILTLYGYDGNTGDYTREIQQAVTVPFKGGLDRDVPPTYHLSPDPLGKPYKVLVTAAAAHPETVTLHLNGTGYTAGFENLQLNPGETLEAYVLPKASGPELTLMGNPANPNPQLAVYLDDASDTYTFDSSTADGYSATERTYSHSTRFSLDNANLPANAGMAIAVDTENQRLYFGNSADQLRPFNLSITNQVRLKDRVQVGASRPDFYTYRLTYDEEVDVKEIRVDVGRQAFFDYGQAIAASLNPGTRSRDNLREELATYIELPLATSLLGDTQSLTETGPISFLSDPVEVQEAPVRGYLLKSNHR